MISDGPTEGRYSWRFKAIGASVVGWLAYWAGAALYSPAWLFVALVAFVAGFYYSWMWFRQ